MNRPDAGDALTDAMVASLAQALDSTSTKSRLVVLRAAQEMDVTGGAELARNLHAIVHSSADMRW